MNNTSERILVLVLGVSALALLFWSSSFLQKEFYLVVDFFQTLVLRNEPLAVAVFILTAVAGALISPFTNLPLVPFAAAIWGPFPTTIFLLGGWLVGDIIAYFIGRNLGRRFVTHFVPTKKLDAWSDAIKQHTNFLTALVARLALPAELGYAFGLVRYPFGLYLIITFIAELPFAFISVSASEAVLAGDVQKFFGVIFISVLIIGGALIKMSSIKK